MEKGDQFYDEGKPFDDEKFDKAEDGHLNQITRQEPPKPFNMVDYTNALMAGFARL